MTYLRYARKTDTTQADIVAGLRKCGVEVVIIGRPVDLLCRRQYWPPNIWQLLEVKTPTRTGKIAIDKRRHEQMAFCEQYKIPKVTTVEEALDALGE